MIRRLIAMLAAVAVAAAAGAQKAPQPDETVPVKTLIRSLELGRPLDHGGLTIIPVYKTGTHESRSYATLDEALKNGWILVSEVEDGRVPQVLISNLSARTIFLMGGEILTGCKQDRILARDILLGPGTKNLLAPVFCVEQGRWRPTSGGFTSKQNLGTPALRAAAQGMEDAAQSEIWERVASENRKMGVQSPTTAYQDAYEKEDVKASVQAMEERLTGVPFLRDDPVGVVIGVGGEPAGVDIFADPELFARQWPKILKSAALSSLGGPKARTLGRDEAAVFLRSLMDRSYGVRGGLDLGTEYVSSGPGPDVRAIADRGGIVHLAGFPEESDRLKVVR